MDPASDLVASPRTRSWAPFLAGAFCLAAFLPLVWPDDRVIDQPDYTSYQLPTREFIRDEIRAGRFPLWIPFIGYGLPLHAGQQATVCYPLLTPLLLVLPVNYALRLVMFLHLLLGFWGQYRLARLFSLSPWGASFAALVTIAGGCSVAHLNAGHVTVLLEFALLPWFFVALFKLLRAPGPWPCAAVAVVLALFVLAGHPQLPYYALLFGGLWTCGSLLRGEASGHRVRVVAWGSAAAIVAGLLVLVQVLPALELMRDGAEFSTRGDSETAGYLAMRPIDLLTLLQPNSMGNPYAGAPVFWDLPIAYHERAAYMGLATILLSLLALSRRGAEAWEAGVVALCTFGMIVALGHTTPLFTLLGKTVPGLWAFRSPARVLAVCSIFYSLLAAHGLETLIAGEHALQRRRLAGLVLGLVALFVGYPIFVLVRSGAVSQYAAHAATHSRNDYLATGLILACTVAVLTLASRTGRRQPRLTCALIMALTLADLWYFDIRHFQLRPRAAEPAPAFPNEARLPVRFSADYPEAWQCRYSDLPEVAARRGCATPLTNEGAYLPAAVERLYASLTNANTSRSALERSATAYVFRRETRTWEPVAAVQPRIRFETGSESTAAGVTVCAEDPQHLKLTVTAPSEGQLVIADTFYPGWICRVDGLERPIHLVEGSFRGVDLSRGAHEVEFAYEPASFRYGLIGTAAGALCLLGLVALGCFRAAARSTAEGRGLRRVECARPPIEATAVNTGAAGCAGPRMAEVL